jgi:Laminin B (Domain IV)
MRTLTTRCAFVTSLMIGLMTGTPAFIRAATVSNTFNTGAGGWKAAGDFAVDVTFTPTGGNPDGNIYIGDAVKGGTTYFVAPAKYHGDHSDTYGQSLTFDLRQVIGSPDQFNDDDVILADSGLTLAYNTPHNPALNGSWTSFTVPLTESGWHVGSIAGTAATQSQFKNVLAAITNLRIRAEYQNGADTDYLDNVYLNAQTLLPGDYDNNQIVDAGDYELWRKYDNTATTLPNDSTPGTDSSDYTVWRANFGQTAGSGAGAIANAVVPEPASFLLLIFAVANSFLRRGRNA